MELVIAAIVAAIVGAGAGFFLKGNKPAANTQALLDEANQKAEATLKEAKSNAKSLISEAEDKANALIEKADARNEQIKQKKIQENKDKLAQMRQEIDEERAKSLLSLKDKELQLINKETEIRTQIADWKIQKGEFQKELDGLNTKKAELELYEVENLELRENLDRQIVIVAKKKEDLDQAQAIQIQKLEQIAKLSESQAKEQILEAVRSKSENDIMVIVKEAVSNAQLTAAKEAKKIVISTIQRMSAEFTIENSVTVFHIESDDIKGQIIGREGRNIRALEQATGAEIVVDDTPETIIISGFDPIRREIARLALKKLVADGRIHPARIEEVVAKTRKQLEEQILEIGEKTVIELDVHGLNVALVRMVGRMRYRSSYGQNLLKHSIETANLCAIMSAELGLNAKQIKMAKRAGLLHDIGKVAEEETELSHALYGMKICEKHGEHPAIVNAVGAHHDEVEMTALIAPIVQACDAISGARPGARREILESYIKRIKEMEDLALTYEGVQKAYAMQAGRELRVILEAEKVSDAYADEVSFLLSQRIQDEMQYPGQVKVTVIREKRAINFAR